MGIKLTDKNVTQHSQEIHKIYVQEMGPHTERF